MAQGSLAADTAPPAREAIALSIGRSTLWPVATRGTISVSNGAVIRVADQRSFVRITALKLGTSVVSFGARQLEVNVVPEASYRIFEALRSALRDRRGLEISSASGALRVTGRLLRTEDWIALAEAVPSASTGTYSFAAAIDPESASSVRSVLRERLRAVGISSVEFRFTPEAVATVGGLSKDERERAEKVLSPFGVRVEANASVLALEPLVRVRILVAEIKKSFLRRYGIEWPEALGGTLMPDLTFGLSKIDFGARLLEQNGWGRVLASPNLLCRSGKEAEFMAGGEFPIKLSSFRANEVVWKSYGVRLHVKPLADASGRMSIAIETEVSEIDESHKANDVPGLFTNKMQTHFDLTRSRTIALSGLIKSGQSHHSSGLPGLSSLPILGPLFSSQEFKDDQSELVIFVTPEVMKADDEALEKAP
jgi:pilus assembly protein CpaC